MRDLDLYNRGTSEYPDSDSTASSPLSEQRSTSTSMPYTTGDGRVDYDRLAVQDGLHTTENLIEAIFNPVPTSSNVPSPFTYFDPENARMREAALLSQTRDTDSADTSIESNNSSSNLSGSGSGSGRRPSKHYPPSERSQRSHSSASSVLEAQKPHWWQKLQMGGGSSTGGGSSRPGTPSGRNFVRPMTPRFSSEVEKVR